MYTLYTDGSAIPNPGPCGCGAVLLDEGENIMWTLSEYLGLGTNNIGELTSILRGCQYFADMELDEELTVYTDSELCVNLVNGTKKTKKEHLVKILEKIKAIQESTPFTIEWVKAHNNLKWNEFADKLADRSITGLLRDSVDNVVDDDDEEPIMTIPVSVQAHVSISGNVPSPMDSENKIYIKSSYVEKDKVKSLGARWDPAKKSWWIQDTSENIAKFSKWIPK